MRSMLSPLFALLMLSACGELQDQIIDGGSCNGHIPQCAGDKISYCFAYDNQDKQEVRQMVCPFGCETINGEGQCKSECSEASSFIECLDDTSYKVCQWTSPKVDGGRAVLSDGGNLDHRTFETIGCDAKTTCQPALEFTQNGVAMTRAGGCWP